MRPLIFLLGFLLTIYVIMEWIEGTIKYSMEGWIGNGVYTVINYFSPNFTAHSTFMTVVYVLTFLLGIFMMFIGTGGSE